MNIIDRQQYATQYGEVFTPQDLCLRILNLAGDLLDDPNTKILDPAVGSGAFLVAAMQVLMDRLSKQIVSPSERRRHILENMLYGVDIQPRNAYLTCLRLDPENHYDLNIKCGDSLANDFWDHQFDVVVGNPPYQDTSEAGNSKGGGNNLYFRFVERSLQMLRSGGRLCFIHPHAWMSPSENGILRLYQTNHLERLICEPFGNCFPQYQKGSNWTMTIYSLCKGRVGTTIASGQTKRLQYPEETIDIRGLPFLPSIVHPAMFSILRKVLDDPSPKMRFTQDRRGVIHDDNHLFFDPSRGYPVRGTSQKDFYTDKPTPILNQPKVLVSRSGYLYPTADSRGLIAGVVPDVYYMIHDDPSIVVRLLDTRLYRTIINTCKWSGFTHMSVVDSLPLIELEGQATDQSVEEYFRLTPQERTFLDAVSA